MMSKSLDISHHGLGGQGGCDRRIEVFGKIHTQKIGGGGVGFFLFFLLFFFFLGGGGSGLM